jgi:hypothetical protein
MPVEYWMAQRNLQGGFDGSGIAEAVALDPIDEEKRPSVRKKVSDDVRAQAAVLLMGSSHASSLTMVRSS